MLKLYVFQCTQGWDACHTLAIVAASQKEAEAIYRSMFDGYSEYKVEVVEIEPGLVIIPGGYDATWLRTENKGEGMEPQYIYVSGATFYFLSDMPGDDPVAESYAACHCDAFGQAKGQPARKGVSYSQHPDVAGLYVKV